jgi:hypothetical protein
MDTFDKIEAMLAELLEQANDQKANSGKLSRKLDGIDGRLSNLEAVSASPQVPESVITLADHDKKMGEVEGQLQKWYGCYEKYKDLYEKLQAEQPYWATKVWPIKAFRWIHDKRHQWIWIFYVLLTIIFSLFICLTTNQKRQIMELQQTQMKYRFIKAVGAAPRAVQYLEDTYEERDGGRIDYIENAVSDYEKALKHKADSIARAERRELERF